MTGGRGELNPVPGPWTRPCFPARDFFRLIAGLAESGTVSEAGGAPVMPRNDVVMVADWGIAERSTTSMVAGLDEPAKP